jgi:hypothetical protein
MLQFLVGDHLRGYDLPLLRTQVSYYYDDEMKIYIDKNGIVLGLTLTHNLESFTRAVALRSYYGCVKVLYEDGTERFYWKTDHGVDHRHEYLVRQ